MMWPAMARQSATSKRSSAREAAEVAAACIRAGMSVSCTRALPSSILLSSFFPAGLGGLPILPASVSLEHHSARSGRPAGQQMMVLDSVGAATAERINGGGTGRLPGQGRNLERAAERGWWVGSLLLLLLPGFRMALACVSLSILSLVLPARFSLPSTLGVVV